jgi:hypothetical protein
MAKDGAISVLSALMTRPNNTTTVVAGGSISETETAGSVVPNPVTISDVADCPVGITAIKVSTNDTGLGAVNLQIRVHIFATDPTLSSGVGAGNHVLYSQKRAGWRGSFLGTFTAFSDGGEAICTPEVTSQPFYIIEPGLNSQTLWWQLQHVTGGVPSAVSTTFQLRFFGLQGRL